MASFPDRLNSLLSQRGETAAELSRAADITERLIGYWRKGEKQPTLENINKLADHFKVSTDFLLGKTDDPVPSADQPQDKITILARNARKLTPEEQEKLYDVARTLFKKAFDE